MSNEENQSKSVRDGQVAQPTETVIPEWALERAAQIWCEPAHESKVMDAEMAKSIARALVERDRFNERRRFLNDMEEKYPGSSTFVQAGIVWAKGRLE